MPNPTWFTLLRAIGHSLDCQSEDLWESEDLYNLAFRNRIDLLYLDALEKQGRLQRLRHRYERLKKRHTKIIEDVARVGVALRARGILYAMMKTLRPYPATPNDIDMFYLGNKSELHEAIKVLIDLGYRRSLEQPGQIGFWDPDRDPVHPRSNHEIDFLDLDMYKSATVKSFCYFLEDQFKQYMVEQEVLDGQSVLVLSPPVDLAFTLFHSVFPNRHYTLEMYYTTLFTVQAFSIEERDLFVRFVRENRIRKPIGTSLGITTALHQAVWGNLPVGFDFLLNALEILPTDLHSIPESFPYLYPLWLFLEVGISRLGEPRLLWRFMGTLGRMMNPAFLGQVLRELFSRQKADERYKLNY